MSKAKEELQLIWKGLESDWMEDREYNLQKGTIAFRRRTRLFDIVLHEVEPYHWAVDFVTVGGEVALSRTIVIDRTGNAAEEAKNKAMIEVFYILNAGLATFGVSITDDPPIDEVRLKQVVVYEQPDRGTLVRKFLGLSEEGKLYLFEDNKWVPHSMKVSKR